MRARATLQPNYITVTTIPPLSAQDGFCPAMYSLALMLASGRGGKRDIDGAKFWYGRAAAKGHPSAMHNLATLLYESNDTSPEALHLRRARELWESAAALGHAGAHTGLGVMYKNAKGELSTPTIHHPTVRLTSDHPTTQPIIHRGQEGRAAR